MFKCLSLFDTWLQTIIELDQMMWTLRIWEFMFLFLQYVISEVVHTVRCMEYKFLYV